MLYLGAISKTTEWSRFTSKDNHSTSQVQVYVQHMYKLCTTSHKQVYAQTTESKEAEVGWLDDLQHIEELTPKKRCPFHHRGLERKSRKSRNTWNNREVWPWSKKWSREKANRVLSREQAGHSKPFPITSEMTPHMDITRQSTLKSDWYILCSQRWRRSTESAKQDLELTVAQIISSLLQNSG